jgi:(+)-trans-carveol dehydrogenase
MAGRVQDKVALVTGAGRGQGRSHVVRLAEEGARVIAVDLPAAASKDVNRYSPYPMATEEDLAETVRIVAAAGGEAVGLYADVRDENELAAAVAAGVDRFGRLDIVSANAGITGFTGKAWELSRENWQAVIDVDLTGTWQTVKAAALVMIDQRCGSIVITASTMGLKGTANLAGYVAAKHGVIGLMRALARELGPQGIRVNAICPGTVRTPMVENDNLYRVRFPEVENPDFEELASSLGGNPLGIPYVEAIDISNALLFLASDEARYITAVALPVDGGALAQ